jgi:Raf kinase inhibitor-like YbhB/YbcL family protein
MLENLPEAIGHALDHQRAGMEKLLFHSERRVAETGRIEITSPAFAAGSPLPRRFTADGAGVSPPLAWRNVPVDAAVMVLIVEDADSPTPEPLVHAIVADIDPRESVLEEGIFSGSPEASPEKLGRNSYLMRGWLPPDPPPGHGVHHYAFQIFALTAGQPLSNSPGRGEVAKAIHERSVGRGCLIGTYQRAIPVSAQEPAESALEDGISMTAPLQTA